MLAGINHGHADRIPTTAVTSCPFPVKCRGRLLLWHDPPARQRHEYTPYSIRPKRFSTSRAPTSVTAYSKGTAPPKPNCGELSHCLAASKSPNTLTALPSSLAKRMTRSDTRGLSFCPVSLVRWNV